MDPPYLGALQIAIGELVEELAKVVADAAGQLGNGLRVDARNTGRVLNGRPEARLTNPKLVIRILTTLQRVIQPWQRWHHV